MAKAKKSKSKAPVKAKSSKPKVKAKAKPKAAAKPKSKLKPKAKAKPKAVKPVIVAKAATPAKINWDRLLKPLDDRLVVEVDEKEKVTAGGLIIPDSAEYNGNYRGKVLSAGRGHQSKKGKVRPMDVRAGDVVLFAEHSGSKMSLQGKNVLILRESEILGIVEKN